MGQQIAYQTHREGVAERFDDPAVPQTIAVDLALRTSDDARLPDLALSIVQTAKQHDAPTCYRLRSIPGVGNILALGRRYEMPERPRCPSVPACVSSCRFVQGTRASAGKRVGTAGKHIGHAHLQWAFSEAPGLFLRKNPAGPQPLARWEHKHGQGTALPIRAHTLARAV